MKNFYFRDVITTVGELRKKLLDALLSLEEDFEDEIVLATIQIESKRSHMNDMIEDLMNNHDEDQIQEIEPKLEKVPPHLIFEYYLAGKEYAMDNDGYWDSFSEGKRDFYFGNILPIVEEGDNESQLRDN